MDRSLNANLTVNQLKLKAYIAGLDVGEKRLLSVYLDARDAAAQTDAGIVECMSVFGPASGRYSGRTVTVPELWRKARSASHIGEKQLCVLYMDAYDAATQNKFTGRFQHLLALPRPENLRLAVHRQCWVRGNAAARQLQADTQAEKAKILSQEEAKHSKAVERLQELAVLLRAGDTPIGRFGRERATGKHVQIVDCVFFAAPNAPVTWKKPGNPVVRLQRDLAFNLSLLASTAPKLKNLEAWTVGLLVGSFADVKIGALKDEKSWTIPADQFVAEEFDAYRLALVPPGARLVVLRNGVRCTARVGDRAGLPQRLKVRLDGGGDEFVDVSLTFRPHRPAAAELDATEPAEAAESETIAGGAFDCPVCFRFYGQRKINICPKGHSLCSECEQTLLRRVCPLCRSPLAGARNLALEEAAQFFAN